MPFNRRNGFKLVSIAWRASEQLAWQILPVTSWDAIRMKKRGSEMRVDDVACNIFQAVPDGHGGAADGRRQGRAVQVDPIKPMLKPPGNQRVETKM
jgi:hypothetical protein